MPFWFWRKSAEPQYQYQPLLATAGPTPSVPSSSSPRSSSEDRKMPAYKAIDADDNLSDDSNSLRGADLILQTPKRTWRSKLWDTLDKSPQERRFLFKLDTVVLTFASLGYFIKSLDQVNINNAYVSGMKDDLQLDGNELNYMIAWWTVGYVLGEIPSNMVLTRLRPSIWIPACEVTWSLLTVLASRASTARQLYVLRFFIGLAESSFYPGMQYVIGSWYRSDELAKRSCIFHAAGAVGSMFSGYLMAGVHHFFGGHADGNGPLGLRPWQWLFVVDTCISLPIAIAGFFMLPDVPEITRAWYFDADEIAMARRRVALEGRASRAAWSWARFRRILSGWHVYALTALYVFFNNGSGFGGQPAFQLWLQSAGYSIDAVNLYPTLTSVVRIVTTFMYAWSSDALLRGARWPPIVVAGAVNVVVYASLAVWDIPDAWKWTCFLLTGCGAGISGLTFAWAHEICKGDNEERALTTGAMNEMAYVFQAWLPLVVWQQVDAPRFHKGFVSNVVISVLLIVTAFLIRQLHGQELRQKKLDEAELDVDIDEF